MAAVPANRNAYVSVGLTGETGLTGQTGLTGATGLTGLCSCSRFSPPPVPGI